jgi:hypothetical protein
MTCWLQLSESFCAIIREKKSALPPAGNGTTMRTGLTGKFCAMAVPARKIASRNAPGKPRIPMRDKTTRIDCINLSICPLPRQQRARQSGIQSVFFLSGYSIGGAVRGQTRGILVPQRNNAVTFTGVYREALLHQLLVAEMPLPPFAYWRIPANVLFDYFPLEASDFGFKAFNRNQRSDQV